MLIGFGGKACLSFCLVDDEDEDVGAMGEKAGASGRKERRLGEAEPSFGSGRICLPPADGSGDERGEDEAEDDISEGALT